MIEFGDNLDWKWVGGLEVVEFTIHVGGAPVICRVSRECLEDHCGDPKTAGEFLDAAKVNFDAITDRIQGLIAKRRRESDGSILLRSADW
ncbi:MAG: DUF1488 family protein [Proteobacteria bacterium]|nr:DUF1488 family protein [Pseudomonadota bacterium]